MDICPICRLKVGEEITKSPFVPSLCWLKTSRIENGRIQMKFGYGDDFEHIFYYPKYCPECGKEITPKQTAYITHKDDCVEGICGKMEEIEKHQQNKERLQKIIMETYNVRPSTAYALTMIVERFAEIVNTEYEYGKQDSDKKYHHSLLSLF